MFDPQFQLTNGIINNLTTIAELKALIESSNIVPKQEVILKKKAAIRMAASSTAIEGNILNEHEVEQVFKGENVYAPQKDEIEVKNYKKGIELINKLLDDKVKLDHTLILHLHKVLMSGLLPDEKVGKYRQGPVYVVNMGADDGKDKLLYTAPEEKDVKKEIQHLLSWVEKAKKEGLHTIIIAALFHYQFVTIHPFTDGNGRETRLLTMYLLYQSGMSLNKIYALDSYYNQDRMQYYTQLDVGKTFEDRKTADLTAWIEYFTAGFVWELERIKQQIQLVKLQTREGERETIFLDQDEIRLIDFLSAMGRMTSADVADILKVSKRSAQLKLKQLLEYGIIEKKGKGPASYYIMHEPESS